MLTHVTSHFSVRLFSFGWERIAPHRWKDENAGSIFWTLYRNDRDGGFLRAGGTVLPLDAEKSYLISPSCRYDYWCGRNISQLYIYLDILGFTRTAINQLFPQPIPLALSETAAAFLTDIATHPQPVVGLAAQWGAMAAISEGLRRAIEALPPDRLGQHGHLLDDVTPMTAALQYIEANLTERSPNRDLAALCSMSEDYFIRRFRECVGLTPAQYVLEVRVKAAAQLLLFSDLSLEEIASQTGFGNRNYFSRVFARQTGMGPAAYRKTRRDGRYSLY